MYSMDKKIINVGYGEVSKIQIGGNFPLIFIGGPCAIESRSHAIDMAGKIDEICKEVAISWVYKSSYDKDCRSSSTSFHGLGLDDGLAILSEIRTLYRLPVTSDFSDPADASRLGEVVDLIQVPAYLCRQTSILRAAAKTGKPVHLKKGQFMSPWNMKNSVRKLEEFGAHEILLTDRGTFFGYNMLVNDMTCLPIMSKTGYPVGYDATHSIQLPTSMGSVSGGQREFIPYLVRAAVGVGVNALFMEVHDNPSKALSDPNTVLDIKYLKNILIQAKMTHEFRSRLIQTLGEDRVHTDEEC
jgi:2-dehydro-3-deoxyphosphooctonate aldolase (KDO 8-P synthase)